MHHIRAGAGDPPLVFIHGFGCSHIDWQPQIEHFAKQHAVAACDLRGHGETPGEAAQCCIETYGADVAAWLAEPSLGGAVLVGHSMGCRVALQAALDAPDRVRALVLIDSSKLGAGDPADAERSARSSIDDIGFTAFSKTFFDGMFVASSHEAIKQEIVSRAAALPAAIGRGLFPRMVAWDAQRMEAALAVVEARRVPLLVIQSTHLNADRVRVSIKPGVDTPWLQTVRRCAPTAQIEIFPNVGHFPQLEAPAHVNRLIASFVGAR